MLEKKLEIFKDEKGIEKGFQIRKKADGPNLIFKNRNIGSDKFYNRGDKYNNIKSLFNYLHNCGGDFIFYLGEGVIEKVKKSNGLDLNMKWQLLELLKNYENNKIEKKSYSTA
jgi:hypothetical protein